LEAEAEILALLRAGDVAAAATLAIRRYGPEIMGLLVALHGDAADADDAFALFAIDLWRGLPTFGGRSSIRTWAYVLARHASAKQRRRVRREVHDSAALDAAVAHVRTETRELLRTPSRDRIARLREALTPEDRLLLVLRVDRDLEWLECARIMSDEGDDPETLARISARLRQRFQAVKDKLRKAAAEGPRE
jgi:RNA polymerase sigma-70 factor (ECF subfamily)